MRSGGAKCVSSIEATLLWHDIEFVDQLLYYGVFCESSYTQGDFMFLIIFTVLVPGSRVRQTDIHSKFVSEQGI